VKIQVDEEEQFDERSGLLLRQSSLLSKNEVKLLFKPYTREDLQIILNDLFLKHLSQIGLDHATYG